MHWRRKWQPTPVFLPGESQGRGDCGLPFIGLHGVSHDRSNLAAAAAASEYSDTHLFEELLKINKKKQMSP